MSKVICSRGYPCAKGLSAQGDWLCASQNALTGIAIGRKHWHISRRPARTSFRHLKLRVVDVYWTAIEGALDSVLVPQSVTPSPYFQLSNPMGTATHAYDGTREIQSPNSGLMP